MMQVREIMSMDPKCCLPTTSLIEVAKLMVEEDCGEIPVCDEGGSRSASLPTATSSAA
jgi:CBS domain-containing protein